jgi:signal transduction histidine kinase
MPIKTIEQRRNSIDGWVYSPYRMNDLMEAEVTCKDGSKKNILWGYIAGEEKNYAFGIDLNERITAEKAKEDLEKQIVRMEKMEALGLLAGGVAHDLNNVLSGIVSYPELLMMGLPNDHHFRKPLELIYSSGLQASAIVNDYYPNGNFCEDTLICLISQNISSHTLHIGIIC